MSLPNSFRRVSFVLNPYRNLQSCLMLFENIAYTSMCRVSRAQRLAGCRPSISGMFSCVRRSAVCRTVFGVLDVARVIWLATGLLRACCKTDKIFTCINAFIIKTGQ